MTQVQTPAQSPAQTRRERQREATYDEIVSASRDLLAEGAELSLRAVAGKMGMTAPALYRYVAATRSSSTWSRSRSTRPPPRPSARRPTRCPSTTTRAAWSRRRSSSGCGRWPTPASSAWRSPTRSPTRRPRGPRCSPCSCSGHLCTDQMRDLWEHNHHPIPALEDLPPAVREAVLDPLIPAEVDGLAMEDRGLLWIYMQGWNVLYGVVALEVFGHMDPRVIESGEMFIEAVRSFAPKLGLADDVDRLEAIMRESDGRASRAPRRSWAAGRPARSRRPRSRWGCCPRWRSACSPR